MIVEQKLKEDFQVQSKPEVRETFDGGTSLIRSNGPVQHRKESDDDSDSDSGI